MRTFSATPSHTGGHLDMHLRRTIERGDYCQNTASRDVVRDVSESRRQNDVEISIHISNSENVATLDNSSFRLAPEKKNRASICM